MDEPNSQDSQLATLIKSRLAEHIGVDVEDIKDEDIFADDLHMSPADFSDFLSNLESAGVDVDGLELTGSASVGELVDQVKAQVVE